MGELHRYERRFSRQGQVPELKADERSRLPENREKSRSVPPFGEIPPLVVRGNGTGSPDSVSDY